MALILIFCSGCCDQIQAKNNRFWSGLYPNILQIEKPDHRISLKMILASMKKSHHSKEIRTQSKS